MNIFVAGHTEGHCQDQTREYIKMYKENNPYYNSNSNVHDVFQKVGDLDSLVTASCQAVEMFLEDLLLNSLCLFLYLCFSLILSLPLSLSLTHILCFNGGGKKKQEYKKEKKTRKSKIEKILLI